MEAPVVVKPEMVSKNASVNEGMLPLIQKGNKPIREKIIHVKVTITEPSRFPIEAEGLRPKNNAVPANARLIADEIRK
jgi:hypothetical protein